MSIEPIKVEITQQKINNAIDKLNISKTEITLETLIDNYDYSNIYILEVKEDIEIPENISLYKINNVIVNKHNITNNGIINDCNSWFIKNSNIINNGIIGVSYQWVLINSMISNGNIRNNCYYWVLLSTDITNCIITGNCYYWSIISSKITNCTIGDNCYYWSIYASNMMNNNIGNNNYLINYLQYEDLILIEKEEYDKLKNGNVKNTVVKKDKMTKLLLLSYLNRKNDRMLK